MTDEQTTMERYTITFYLLPQYDQSQILHSLTADFPLQDTRWENTCKYGVLLARESLQIVYCLFSRGHRNHVVSFKMTQNASSYSAST